MDEDRRGRRRRPWRRRLRRWAAGSLAACALLLAAAWAFRQEILERAVLPYALSGIESELGLVLGVGSVTAGFDGTVTARGIEGRGGARLPGLVSLRAERLEVRLSPIRALRGLPSWLRAVEVEGLRAAVDPARGAFLPRAEGPRAGADGPGVFPAVSVRDAEVTVLGPEPASFRIAEARLRAQAPSEEAGVRGTPRVEVDLLAAGLELGRAGPLDAHGTARVDFAAAEAPEIQLERLSVALGRSEVEASGVSRGWPPRFDPLVVRAPCLELEDFEGLAGAALGIGVAAWGELWLRGDPSDLPSIAARARIGASALLDGRGEPFDVAATAELASGCVFLEALRVSGGDLEAELAGEVHLAAPAAGRLTALRGRVAGEPFLLSGHLAISAGDGGLRLEPFRLISSAGPIEIALSIDRSGFAEGTLVAPSVPLEYLSSRLGATFREVRGSASLEGSAVASLEGGSGGLLRSFRLAALARISGGEARFFGSLPSAADVQAEIELTEERVRLRSLEGRLGASPFRVSGELRFEPPSGGAPFSPREVDLSFRSRGTLLVRRADLRVRGDLDLRWRGPWERTALEGAIDVTRAYYLADVPLAPARGARLPLELFSLRTPPFDSMRLAVALRSRRGISVENNLASARASADLRLEGTGAFPVLTGFLTAEEGRAWAGNQRLEVRSSSVEFRARDPMNPALRIALGRRLRGYDVSVTIAGTYDAPEVLLDSSPPLDPNALAILILTGMTPREVSEQGGGRVAATQAAMYIGRQIVDGFSSRDPNRSRSFLDDISIETESAPRAGRADPLRVEYRVFEGFPFPRAEIFVQGERDMYSDYNLNAGIRFELQR